MYISLTVPSEYPEVPSLDWTVQGCRLTRLTDIRGEINSLVADMTGFPMVYDVLSTIKDRINEAMEADQEDSEGKEEGVSREEEEGKNEEEEEEPVLCTLPYAILEGPTITDRKSVFKGYGTKVESAEQAFLFRETLLQDRKIARFVFLSFAYTLFVYLSVCVGPPIICSVTEYLTVHPPPPLSLF